MRACACAFTVSTLRINIYLQSFHLDFLKPQEIPQAVHELGGGGERPPSGGRGLEAGTPLLASWGLAACRRFSCFPFSKYLCGEKQNFAVALLG